MDLSIKVDTVKSGWSIPLYILRGHRLYMGPKKNNCVVRVTAEKTLGRVGRYFFYFFCDALADIAFNSVAV